MMIDARSRRSWDINTGNQDVLCQTFGSSSSSSGADPNVLFSGLRNGAIALHDLRTAGAQPKFKLVRPHRHLASSDKKAGNVVTSLKFPAPGQVGDGSYIYSGYFSEDCLEVPPFLCSSVLIPPLALTPLFDISFSSTLTPVLSNLLLVAPFSRHPCCYSSEQTVVK